MSAYRSDSHASWADWLQRNLAADWRVLELPGRYFRWRIRGNPLSWRVELKALLQEWQPDRLLATSMVDLATLKGLLPELANIPCSYYFHENQFAYPLGEGQHSSIDPQMVQLYGALAADELLFNSRFNQQSFLAGLAALLKKLPDFVPPEVTNELAAKSSWLPVVVESNDFIPLSFKNAYAEAPLILWSHRWEYDKCPERFLELLQQLQAVGQPFQLALLGPRAAKTPAVLQQIREQFADQIVVDGKVSRADYWLWLERADIAVSTACHEFQGLSMLEAAAMGCLPLVPDDLCYQEQYPLLCRYPAGDSRAAAESLQKLLQVRQQGGAEWEMLQHWQQHELPVWLSSTNASASVESAEQRWQHWLAFKC
nr:DUF3524 domain-containing protein [Oceanobacter mangrovi]